MKHLNGTRVLYISYNGVTEPLVTSQVLSYIRGLSEFGVSYHLLTFEKEAPKNEKSIRKHLAAQGIVWDWLPYYGKNGLAGSCIDTINGLRFIFKRRKSCDFIHCRSFFPSLMAASASVFSKTPFLYDCRGLWALEKAYKGRISSRVLFKFAHFMEMRLFRHAKMMVTLTEAGKVWIIQNSFKGRKLTPIYVIPTCVDISPYQVSRRRLNFDSPSVVYSGSLGEGYLRDEVFRFFGIFKLLMPKAKLNILSRSDRNLILESALQAGLREGDFTLRNLPAEQVPEALMSCDLAISFIKPDISKIASCPTKMAEYLAAGLPVVANGSIGDVKKQLAESRVGVVIDDFSQESLENAARRALDLLRDPDVLFRAHTTAVANFSLQDGIETYRRAYEEMLL